MSTHFFKIEEHVVPGQHIREYPNGARSDDDVLELAVKHYTPLEPTQNGSSGGPSVTIIAGHANGFPKECYEPLFDELLTASRTQGFRIRGIWIADTVHQGASYVINEAKVGDDFGWPDHARDLLQMINHFRAEIKRPIMGLAHSFGATILTFLAHMHPRLFHGLALIEPVMSGRFAGGGANVAAASTVRRDLWPSRAAAAAAMHRSAFFSPWDSRALDCYLTFGLRELPTRLYSDPAAAASASGPANEQQTPVTLTTTKHQEAWTFLRPQFAPYSSNPADQDTVRLLAPDLDRSSTAQFAFHRAEMMIADVALSTLRPSVLWVFGGRSYLSTPEIRADRMARTGTGVGGSGGAKMGRVKEVVLDAGHMVPFEKVGEVGGAVATWMGEEVRRWVEEEEFLKRQDWGKSKGGEGTEVSEQWKERVKRPSNTKRAVKEKL